MAHERAPFTVVPASNAELLTSRNPPDRAKPVRACINCVRAKSKCSPNSLRGGKCERCMRLKKECVPSPPPGKRRKTTRTPRNRVEKVEEKLDGIIALLKSTPQGTLATDIPSLQAELGDLILTGYGSGAGSLPSGNDPPLIEPQGGGSVAGTGETANSGLTAANTPSSGLVSNDQSLDSSTEPTRKQAELYLRLFRQEFLPHLPVFFLPPSTTSRQLREESPLLWRSIMTVASTHSTQHVAMSREFRAILGRQAFTEGTRTMDFLLAVLVYTAWDRRHCLDKPILVSLVQLAISILYDLGLDKPPSLDPGLMLPYEFKGAVKPSRFSRAETLAERRALLGCFLLSTLPSFLGKGESLHWTPYYDECLRILENSKECESDALLVQMVKLRLIVENVTYNTGHRDTEGDQWMTLHGSAYLKSLEAHLRNFRSNIPIELNDNKDLQLELENAELIIHSIAFSPSTSIFPAQPKRRFLCLNACLHAVKSWVEIFFTIPTSSYIGFSEIMYGNMMRCLVGIYRLWVCDHPEWDRTLLSDTLDVPWVLDEAARRFSSAGEAVGFDPDGSPDQDYFSAMASKMEFMKHWWLTMTGASAEGFTPALLAEPLDFSGEFFDFWNW